jgi:FecR protein
MRRSKLVFLALVGLAVPAAAQEDYRHGRIRYLEPQVTLQRATETGAEEAVVNLPYLPGDRVWTDASGRGEFQFESGALVRLDSRSKLDYAAHDEGRDGRVVLRLWSGGLYLRVRNRGDEGFLFETPGGLVEVEKRGVYRLDVDSGEVRLSVYEGEAKLEAGGERVDVDAGERAYARRGESVEPPRRFDRGEDDEFARWDQDREGREAWAAGSRKYLPDELDTYAGEFESNGTWYYEGDVGYVWRPTVAAGWRPYWNGRWVWTAYGWTWAPNEPWGWAPFHYGRWGFSVGLGWYWMPGRIWGPGWVSWAVAGDYVGWCPLGYRDRPVYWSGRGHGYAVPRGHVGEAPSAWAFVKRGDVGARDVAVRRVDLRPETLGEVRIAESPRIRLSRDARELREVPVTRGEIAVPRTARVKPTPADSVPELGTDRQTTIPTPAITRRRPAPREDPARREDPTRYDRQPVPDESSATRAPRDDRPTDTRSPRRGGSDPSGAVPRYYGPRPEGSGRPDPDTRSERDRDVLRPLFQPLSEPRNKRGEESRPRDEGRPRDDGRPREGARPRDEGRAREGGSGRGQEAAPPTDRERRPPPQAAPPPPPPRQERANPPPRPDNSRSSPPSSSPSRSPEQARPRAKRGE